MSRPASSSQTQQADGVSSHPDDRSVQADSRYSGFALQGESNAGSGKPGLAATGQCASPANAEATDLNNTDRFLFVWLYHWFPSALEVVAIVRPETIIRWHRTGFRAYWRWRSRNRV